MKNWIIACFLLAGLGLSAQQMPGRGYARGKMEKFSASELASLQSKRMTLALDLTDAQENKLAELLTERIEKRRAMHQERRAQRDSTRTARPGPDFASAEARMDNEIAFRREIREILTEAQYENWKQMHSGRRKFRHGRKSHRG